MSKRPVVVHFHLFKNAGTSVDKILQQNFGDKWVEIEGQNNRKLLYEELIAFIRDNPQYKAISSHTAVVSVPPEDDIEIIPVFFFRHPIARIRSAYNFERLQVSDTLGAVKAKEGDFNYYMDWRLSTPAPWQIQNFHGFRLKDFHQPTPNKQVDLFEPRSRAALEALPMVGLVEKFDQSMRAFERLIQEKFPDFKAFDAHENVTSKSANIDESMKDFSAEIGAAAYEKLVEINAIDFALYKFVKSQFQALIE